MGKQLNVSGLLYHAVEGMNRDAVEYEFGRELMSIARECNGQTSNVKNKNIDWSRVAHSNQV